MLFPDLVYSWGDLTLHCSPERKSPESKVNADMYYITFVVTFSYIMSMSDMLQWLSFQSTNNEPHLKALTAKFQSWDIWVVAPLVLSLSSVIHPAAAESLLYTAGNATKAISIQLKVTSGYNILAGCWSGLAWNTAKLKSFLPDTAIGYSTLRL